MGFSVSMFIYIIFKELTKLEKSEKLISGLLYFGCIGNILNRKKYLICRFNMNVCTMYITTYTVKLGIREAITLIKSSKDFTRNYLILI